VASRLLPRLVLISIFVTNCTRTVDVPLTSVEEASRKEGRYQIEMDDASRYIARGFAVTDSMIIITRLDEHDTRYMRNMDPISLPLRDVKSVQSLEQNGLTIDILVVIGMAAVMYAIALFRDANL